MKLGRHSFLVSLLVSNSNALSGMSDLETNVSTEHAVRDLRGVNLCETLIPDEYILPAKFGRTNHCYKIQVKNRGKFYVNTEDQGCVGYNDGSTYKGSAISSYQDAESGSGQAVYKGVWSGSITLVEDPSLSEAKFEVTGNAKTKIFSGTLTVPLCTNVCESISPSEYILPARFGSTNHCYKIQVQDSGKLFVSTKDAGCVNYNEGKAYRGAAISAYQGTETGGEAIYVGTWSGSISLKQDPSMSEAKFEVSGSGKTKTFTGTLTVPRCDN